MARQKSITNRIGGPLLSWGLLVIAYATYGQFMHSTNAAPLVWGLSMVFAISLAGILTIFWVSCRRIILMGFQSDLGYAIMVLVLASLAVVAVVQFRVFSYFVVLVAVSLLARIDTLISDYSNGVTFLLLSALAMVGLGLSWLPTLLGSSHAAPL